MHTRPNMQRSKRKKRTLSFVTASLNKANGNRHHQGAPDAFAIQIWKIYTSEFQFIGLNPEIHRQANFQCFQA